jgi:hypothetical protein
MLRRQVLESRRPGGLAFPGAGRATRGKCLRKLPRGAAFAELRFTAHGGSSLAEPPARNELAGSTVLVQQNRTVLCGLWFHPSRAPTRHAAIGSAAPRRLIRDDWRLARRVAPPRMCRYGQISGFHLIVCGRECEETTGTSCLTKSRGLHNTIYIKSTADTNSGARE